MPSTPESNTTSANAKPNDEARPKTRYRVDPGWAATALVLIAVTAAWAFSAADPDFPLPDPFHPIAFVLAVVFLASGWIRWDRPRRALQVALFIPVVAIMLLEARVRFRAPDPEPRALRTKDRLLRYQYVPGHPTGETAPGSPSSYNHLGLFDQEYEIPKPAGVYRIAVLSGSVANDGFVPYPQRFHALLETRLADALPGRRVEVVNVSCEGYNTIEEVRLLELVGLAYEPDLVVVAHMLTGATIQDGSGRRWGDAYFAGRLYPLLSKLRTGSICAMVEPFYDGYSFELVTRSSLERLGLLAKIHGFQVLVAALPAMERFDDPSCLRMYDKVLIVARELGFHTVRVVDWFRGESFTSFTKPDAEWDFCHPNAAGHARYADALEAAVRPILLGGAPTAGDK